MAIFVVLFAIYCVKNTTRDLIYAITGRVPPSFVREQQRMQFARDALASRTNSRPAGRTGSPSRGFRGFFRNAYNDAWETADEKRERRREERAKRRQERRDAEDGKAPAPIETDARPEEKATVLAPNTPPSTPDPLVPSGVIHDDDTYVVGGKQESLYQRYAMRRRNAGQPMTTVAVADELGIPVADAEKLQAEWDRRYQRETSTDSDQPPAHLLEYQKRSRCRDCSGEITLSKDPERAGQWIVGVKHAREDCPQNVQRPMPREQHDQKVEEPLNALTDDTFGNVTQEIADNEVDHQDRERSLNGMFGEIHEDPIKGTQYRDWASAPQPQDPFGRETASPITKENSTVTNPETTGLQSGLEYNASMAATCTEGASSVEQSIAALENGEVGQAVTGPMAQGREHLEAAAACFEQAHTELESHVTVKEGYDANPDAGNKGFMTGE